MNTKRFFFMLVVALVSVMGAWAQEPTKLRLTEIKSAAHYQWSSCSYAVDGDLNTYWDVAVDNGKDAYIEFMTAMPVRVDEYRVVQVYPTLDSWEIRASAVELDDDEWNTAEIISSKTDVPNDQKSDMFSTELSQDSRYQYFRFYLKSQKFILTYLSEIEFYVTCEHLFDGTDSECSKCGYKNIHFHDFSAGDCACGMPHPHNFNSDGTCTVANCGYNAKDLAGFMAEVADESELGTSSSTNKTEIKNLFDGDTSTKWEPQAVKSRAMSMVTAIFKTLQPVCINGYSFYFAKDFYDGYACVPKSWNLYGYDETSKEWVLLHEIVDQAASANRYNSYRFQNDDESSYQYFKWEITDVEGFSYDIAYLRIGEFSLDVTSEMTHTHEYSEEWSSDDEYHWHQCFSTIGQCSDPQKDKTAHVHSIYSKVCDVCGHVSTHEHNWDENFICTLCGVIHTHQFDGEGKCTVAGCGYNAKEWIGFISGVDNETIGGSHSTVIKDSRHNGNVVSNLFDGNTGTRWTSDVNPAAVAIFKTASPASINGYTFLGSTGVRHEDCSIVKSWTLYGLDDASGEWVAIHSVKDAVEQSGWSNYRFNNSDNAKYSYFKLEVTDRYKSSENRYNLICISEFSIDILEMGHEHNYSSEWVPADGEYHSRKCINPYGICTEPKVYEAHSYDESILTEGYYICNECKYVNTDRKADYDALVSKKSEAKTQLYAYAGEKFGKNFSVAVITIINDTRTAIEAAIDDDGVTAALTAGVDDIDNGIAGHEHHYHWTVNETQHKKECYNEDGFCTELNPDYVNHSYEESILDDSSFYTCECRYINEETKAQFDVRDYMSMTAVGGDVTIGFKKVGNPDKYTIQVSKDGNHWSEPQTLTVTTELARIPKGKTYYFRHGAAEATTHVSNSDNDYWSFTMDGNGTIEAGGNVMSLLDMTCKKNSLDKYTQHVFSRLFLNCKLLTVAPKIVTTTVGNWNFPFMFAGTSIKVAPELTAATVEDGAYRAMFQDCKELISVPKLTATKLARCAYLEMFKGCEKLEMVEIGDATSHYDTSKADDNPYRYWLKDTAANGKVITSLTMIGNETASSHMPHGWNWAVMLNANEDPDKTGFYTTFYDSHHAYTLPEDVKAYTASIGKEDDDTKVMLTSIKDNVLPKGVAVLVHSTTTGEMLMTLSGDEGNMPETNLFKGVDVDTPQNGEINFMLSYGQEGLGFYQMKSDMKLTAHKAFLPETVELETADTFGMSFVDESPTGGVNGIEEVSDGSASTPTKIYNLSGQRLNSLRRGINIVNGKKIMAK